MLLFIVCKKIEIDKSIIIIIIIIISGIHQASEHCKANEERPWRQLVVLRMMLHTWVLKIQTQNTIEKYTWKIQIQNTHTYIYKIQFKIQIQKYKGVKLMRRDPQAISCCWKGHFTTFAAFGRLQITSRLQLMICNYFFVQNPKIPNPKDTK